VGLRTLREAVPTVVMHMAAAAVHLMSAVALGGSLGPLYGAVLAGLLLAIPMMAVLAMLAGQTRLGSVLFLGAYVGMAGLAIYGLLGEGLLPMAFYAPASPWKTLFFATAMLLPLLQITGIVEAAKALVARSGRPRLIRDLE